MVTSAAHDRVESSGVAQGDRLSWRTIAFYAAPLTPATLLYMMLTVVFMNFATDKVAWDYKFAGVNGVPAKLRLQNGGQQYPRWGPYEHLSEYWHGVMMTLNHHASILHTVSIDFTDYVTNNFFVVTFLCCNNNNRHILIYESDRSVFHFSCRITFRMYV